MSSTYANTFLSLGGHLSVTHVGITLVVLFLASKALSYQRGLQVRSSCTLYAQELTVIREAVSNLPGFRVPFHPFSLPGVLTPTTWWNPGFYFVWNWRDSRKHRCTDLNWGISLRTFFMSSVQALWKRHHLSGSFLLRPTHILHI